MTIAGISKGNENNVEYLARRAEGNDAGNFRLSPRRDMREQRQRLGREASRRMGEELAMSDIPPRPEINARLETAEARAKEVEARLEVRFVQIEGKLDLIGTKVDSYNKSIENLSAESKSQFDRGLQDNRETRRTIAWVTITAMLGAVAIIIAVQFGIVAVFSAALQASTKQSQATLNPPTPAASRVTVPASKSR